MLHHENTTVLGLHEFDFTVFSDEFSKLNEMGRN